MMAINVVFYVSIGLDVILGATTTGATDNILERYIDLFTEALKDTEIQNAYPIRMYRSNYEQRAFSRAPDVETKAEASAVSANGNAKDLRKHVHEDFFKHIKESLQSRVKSKATKAVRAKIIVLGMLFFIMKFNTVMTRSSGNLPRVVCICFEFKCVRRVLICECSQSMPLS